jgi:hypothetical protein
MEPEGSLPHSQEPATCPYPEPYQSTFFWDMTLHYCVICRENANACQISESRCRRAAELSDAVQSALVHWRSALRLHSNFVSQLFCLCV